ncbi:MAG: cation transporter, partial [Lachnospiraceae bacterium]
MDQYIVTGMTCASCQAHVEKAVAKVPGVSNVSVSLLTNSMAVEGTASPQEIIQAVERAGYGAQPKGEGTVQKESASAKLAAEEDALK